MKIAVLGAGVVGISAAYYLSRAGHQVTVIERRAGAGLETSFANGGQISASHAAPWAAPEVPWQMLKWLGRKDAPLLYRFRLDPAQWQFSLRFLRNCTAGRARHNTAKNLRLALYSRSLMGDLRATTGIEYDHRGLGILQIFRHQKDLDRAAGHAEQLRQLGCHNLVLGAAESCRVEPALAEGADDIVGSIHTPADESGDAHTFCRALAAICQSNQVEFRYGLTIRGWRHEAGKITAAVTDHGDIQAAAFVVALGSYSPVVLRPLGIKLPVYPTKGYSVTIATTANAGAPRISLTDVDNRLVYSRLGDRLRVAGTAEFAGYDTTLDKTRARSILAATRRQFPNAGNFEDAELWTALRPLTPDGVPVIGRTGYDNLFLDTGHGTLGWTMAAGSGQVIADLIGGRTPAIEITDLGLDRF